MSRLRLTRVAIPATPAADKSEILVDTNDRRTKQIDDNGVISILNNDGLQDRNILANGGFNVQQRVATASTLIPLMTTSTRAGQVSDRWAVTTSVATGLNWAQIDTSSSVETGLLARYYGSLIASGAGKKVMLSQFIINSEMAALRGQKVRISVKTNQKVGSAQTLRLGLLQLSATGTVDVCPAFLTGAWSVTTGVDPAWGTNLAVIAPDASPTGENGTVGASWLAITTQVTTWVRSSCVFTVPTTSKNLCVVLFTDATGGTTDNLSIAEFQLTQGPDIVYYVEPPLADTILRCQQFFCKSFPATVVPAASLSEATAGSGAVGSIGKAGALALAANYLIEFPMTMWKTPTVTYFTPTTTGAQCWRFSGAAAAAQTSTATRTSSITDHSVIVTATGDAGGAVGDLVGVHYTADSEFSA